MCLGVRPDREPFHPTLRSTAPPGAFLGRLVELGFLGQELTSGAVENQAVWLGSAMEASRVAAGDDIVSIDGRPVQELDGLRQALAVPRDG